MLKYIGKRLLLMIPVMLGVIIIVFTLMYITPGDPVDSILAGDMATPEAKEALREELGLNGTYFERLFKYIKGLLTGDMGIDYITRVPVFTRIKETFPITLKVAFFATLAATILGVTIGILSAIKQYSIFDTIGMVIAMVGNSMPSFWEGLLFMLLFALRWKLLPSTGIGTWKHLVMPVMVTGTHAMASIARMTRSSMLEVIRSDYITTARSKGHVEWRVILKHALPNALIPIITVVGLQFRHLLGGSVISEAIFNVPGMGTLIIQAITARNYQVVQGAILVTSLALSIINLVVDLLYSLVDPRIKSQYH